MISWEFVAPDVFSRWAPWYPSTPKIRDSGRFWNPDESSHADRARVERLKTGTVPVQNLREAVWMMLFRGEAEVVQLKAEYYPLPAGFIPHVTVREGQGDLYIEPVTVNTGQTSLTWRWMPPTGATFLGQLTWPDSYDAAEDHAVSLLNIAEEGLIEGCAAQRVPAPTGFRSQRARNLNDVSAGSIEELDHDFGKAFEKWKALAVCRPVAR